MYPPATAAVPTPYAARWIDRLPVAAWSPGLRRTVRISERQRDLLAIVDERHAWRLRELAPRAGYPDAAGASRALRTLDRLGLIAHSCTRGRAGSTVAWVRAGARVAQPLAALMRSALSLARRNVSPIERPKDHHLPMDDTLRPPASAPARIPPGRHLIRDPETGLWRVRRPDEYPSADE